MVDNNFDDAFRGLHLHEVTPGVTFSETQLQQLPLRRKTGLADDEARSAGRGALKSP